MPCAIVIGAAPVIAYTGAQKLAIDQDEMTVAGALAGAPIRTAKAITVDLEVPADAEIVIEGLIDPDMLEPEGPFGESNGYVALEDFNMSMEVTAITRRRSAVFVSILSQVTPSESSIIKKVAMEPLFLNHLRNQLSLKSVRRVVMHEPLSNLRPIIFVQFSNGTPRMEVWRGLQGTAAKQADCGKIVIAVSEDIDPSNTDAVMWSLAYRSNPIEDVHIEPYRSAGHAPKSGPGGGLDHVDRRDPQISHGAARAAGTRIHGARTDSVAGARLASAYHPAALARLFARRLDRDVGSIRAQRRLGRVGKERREYLGAPARWVDTRDSCADGRARNEIHITLVKLKHGGVWNAIAPSIKR